LKNLIQFELFKIFSKWRTYTGFIVIGLLVVVIQLVMGVEGQNFIDAATSSMKSNFDFQGDLLNAYMINRIILQTLIVWVPFLITLVAGDMLAGEASLGTYRLLLIRPASRLQVISAKYISGIIYTFVFMVWIVLLSLGLGILSFGTGDMIVIGNSILIIPENDVFWRYMLAYGIATLSMMVVFTVAFTFSAFVQNSLGPIFTTMGLVIGFSILNVFNTGILEYINPILFTTYTNSWKLLFENPLNFNNIYLALSVLFVHIVVLLLITFTYFNKKDISS